MKLEQYTAALDRSIGKRDVLRSQQAQYSAGVAGLIILRDAIEKAQVLIQRVALETQEVLRIQIADVVQSALDACFPDEYRFEVEFKVARNKTECNLKFFKGEFQVDPITSDGGGLCDVSSFGLRVAAWSLGTSTDCLILDEPGKWLSKDLQPLFANIIKEISERLHLQIIEVSHIPEMIESADKVFKVSMEKKDGWEMSHVKEIG